MAHYIEGNVLNTLHGRTLPKKEGTQKKGPPFGKAILVKTFPCSPPDTSDGRDIHCEADQTLQKVFGRLGVGD